MKNFIFALMVLGTTSSAMAAKSVYHCVERYNDFMNGPGEEHYMMILDGHKVYYYLETGKIFDGSDLADELRTVGTRWPAAGIGTIAEKEGKGNYKVIGESLVSQYEAKVYGRPLGRWLLITESIYKGEKKGKMVEVTLVHDGRSKDPKKALAPRMMQTSCTRTK